MKAWKFPPSWFDSYANKVSELKVISAIDGRGEIRRTTERALKRVYRAVAFDIDGTLTKPGSAEVDERMALTAAELLKRGVPVFLVTGRGRTGRDAARRIRDLGGLTSWYLRRLYCLAYNGAILLRTRVNTGEALLESEQELTPRLAEPIAWAEEISARLSREGISGIQVDRSEFAIRLVCAPGLDSTAAYKIVADFVGSLRLPGLSVVRGNYSGRQTVDLCTSTKRAGLLEAAKLLGVSEERILRLGDKGGNEGNDFDLLDSQSGFSVSEFSDSTAGCFPVLDAENSKQLVGADATEALLGRVLLFPPLSLAANAVASRIPSLRESERLAIRRSREQAHANALQLKLRAREMLTDHADLDVHGLREDEVFDPASGAVRLRDWELLEGSLPTILPDLFELSSYDPHPKQAPRKRWWMLSDTALLLRGPGYYHHKAKAKANSVEECLEESSKFVQDSLAFTAKSADVDPSFLVFKLVLAMMDNVRNALLRRLSAILSLETNKGITAFDRTKLLYTKAIVPHTAAHVKFLIRPDTSWRKTLTEYGHTLKECIAVVAEVDAQLTESSRVVAKDGAFFKYRECDHLMQNLSACQLALLGFRQALVSSDRPIVAVGLSHGGNELPAIMEVVAGQCDVSLSSALLRISHYSDTDGIRDGEEKYVLKLLESGHALVHFGEVAPDAEPRYIICDDNITTAITLQMARDFVVCLGGDVVGAAIIRYPGINRLAQMTMSGHGCPDPEVLFGFIRGLVAPSPYARLLYPRKGSKEEQYLDQTGVFDKAKARIERYLLKNAD